MMAQQTVASVSQCRQLRRWNLACHTARMAATDCSGILKALADPTRQQIVKALLTRDLSVNTLTEELGVPQYNTSKHLRVLKEAGIVECRAIGKLREYALSDDLRKRLRRTKSLDFGCCSFRVEEL